jgi:8-oxo-dGTP diphosphatase
MLRAIIFDVGNVLISWSGESVYADIKEELGFDDEQLALFSKKYLGKLGRGEITEEELWADAEKELQIRKVNVSENLLGRKPETEGVVFRDVLEFAKELKSRGFKLALMSNTISAHEKVFTSKGITEPFEHIFLSHKVGLRKPDPNIYLHALQQLQVKPSEALFIDDLQENVEAAQKLGMYVLHADKPDSIVSKIERELEKDFVGSKVALTHDGRVLTILRDDKEGISFPGYWDFTGGGRENDETPVKTVIRETREELGITLNPEAIVWQKFYPGVVDPIRTACFLVAELSDKQINDITFGDEGQKWKLMTFQEFLHHPKAIEGMKARLHDYLLSEGHTNLDVIEKDPSRQQ